jgi:hypothetical protein
MLVMETGFNWPRIGCSGSVSLGRYLREVT